jgi:hypothetical protein
MGPALWDASEVLGILGSHGWGLVLWVLPRWDSQEELVTGSR